MNIWMLATMALYVIPVFYFLDDFEHVEEAAADTFPDMDAGFVRAAGFLIILFWPITAIIGILFVGEE